MPMCLAEFRRAIQVRGLVLSADPPGFTDFVVTPWGNRIPAAVNSDAGSQVGQIDYLRWLDEVLDEVAGREVELPWTRQPPCASESTP